MTNIYGNKTSSSPIHYNCRNVKNVFEIYDNLIKIKFGFAEVPEYETPNSFILYFDSTDGKKYSMFCEKYDNKRFRVSSTSIEPYWKLCHNVDVYMYNFYLKYCEFKKATFDEYLSNY